MDQKKKRWCIGLLAAAVIGAGMVSTAEKHSAGFKNTGHVAVIRVQGPITGGDSGSLLQSGEGVTSGQLMKEFREARKDENVKAVLLRLDSPGGSASAAQEIAWEIDKYKDAGKPLIVSIGDTAASAAYWLASKGDTVYANPGTMTGSIGVYMEYYNVQELADKLGVTEEKIKSGKHKDIFSPFREMTEEERAIVQGMVNDIYEQFLDEVAKGRHMDKEEVRQLADGRIYTGRQALDKKLVDKMGNYYDALEAAAEAGGLNTVDIPVVEYGKPNSLAALLQGYGRTNLESELWTRLLPRLTMRQEEGRL